MLTFEMCNQLLNLAKEYEPKLKEQVIRVFKGNEFKCIAIRRPLQDTRFKIEISDNKNDGSYHYYNIGTWLKEKYNLCEAGYMMKDFHNIFSFLHEVGHVIGEYTLGYDAKQYEELKLREFISSQESFEAYRNIPTEAYADKFAVEVINKYIEDIYIIAKEFTTIEEIKQEIAFWNCL